MRSRTRARPSLRSDLRAAVLGFTALALAAACNQILNGDGIELVLPERDAGSPGSSGPEPCEAGAFRCQGPALQLCDVPEQGFRSVRVCASAELCCGSAELCGGQPACLAPSCAEGEFRCRGEVLEQCNPGQTGFVELDRCPSAVQCNASLGRCTDAPCDAVAREHQCNGPNLEECLPGRSEWSLTEACASSGLCGTAAPFSCEAPDCRIGGSSNPPNPYQCVSGNLMRCNDTQTDWEFVETCLNTANCNAQLDDLRGDPFATAMTTQQLSTLGCTPPGCAPGRYRCQGGQLSLCGANRTNLYDPVATCDSARQCDANLGRCTAAPCSEGQRQCSGDEYQVCTAEGWQVLQRCETGAPCDAQAGCLPTTCRPNEYRCEGAELQRCNVERTGWIPVETCDSAGLCNVDTRRCEPAACLPGARRCAPFGQLETCRADQSGYDLVSDCAALAGVPRGPGASALCDPTGSGQCLPVASCTSGALRCNGAELQRCRDNAWRPYAHCETPAQCDAAGGACLPAVCEPGSFRCVAPGTPPVPVDADAPRLGLGLEVCNPTGTGYDAVRQCSALELCDDAHGQCDICDPTRPILCGNGDLLVCTADGQERTLYKGCTQGCVEAGTEGSNRTACREDLGAATSN